MYTPTITATTSSSSTSYLAVLVVESCTVTIVDSRMGSEIVVAHIPTTVVPSEKPGTELILVTL